MLDTLELLLHFLANIFLNWWRAG